MAANPWLDRRVIAYAHQGGAKEAPSSTLYAVRAALEHGATGIELDVHSTRDGVLVVCHDQTVDRTTDGTGDIADLDLAQLRRLDNAYWFCPGLNAVRGRPDADYPLRGRAPSEGDLGVATLAEVLEAFPDAVLNLDIKRTAPQAVAYEAALAAELVACGRTENVIVASFFDSAIEAFSSHAPGIAVAAGTDVTTAFYNSVRAGSSPPEGIGRYAALQVPPRFGSLTVVDGRFVDAAHDCGLAVHVWTVDDPAEMERLVGLGVDGIISDVPSVLAGELARLGAAWTP